MKYWFWTLWGIDALVAAGFVGFFFIGLADGTVSSFNIVLWLTILGVLAALLGGRLYLRAQNLTVVALVFLALLAVPALFSLLLLILVIVLHPRWN